jgi:hypothetical protein
VRRVEEIGKVSKFLHKRNTDRQTKPDGEPDNVIMLGDFNIFNKLKDRTMKALEENKFVVPSKIKALKAGSNLGRSKDFDQIAFHDPYGRLKSSKAGIFAFTDCIYGDGDAEAYRVEMEESAPARYKPGADHSKAYRQWRTFQISDHLPLWVEIRTNFADAFLATRLRRASVGKK